MVEALEAGQRPWGVLRRLRQLVKLRAQLPRLAAAGQRERGPVATQLYADGSVPARDLEVWRRLAFKGLAM